MINTTNGNVAPLQRNLQKSERQQLKSQITGANADNNITLRNYPSDGLTTFVSPVSYSVCWGYHTLTYQGLLLQAKPQPKPKPDLSDPSWSTQSVASSTVANSTDATPPAFTNATPPRHLRSSAHQDCLPASIRPSCSPLPTSPHGHPSNTTANAPKWAAVRQQ
jgi:hypothetical protein